MRNYMERCIGYMQAEEKKKQKEIAYRERMKKFKEKEKNNELLH